MLETNTSLWPSKGVGQILIKSGNLHRLVTTVGPSCLTCSLLYSGHLQSKEGLQWGTLSRGQLWALNGPVPPLVCGGEDQGGEGGHHDSHQVGEEVAVWRQEANQRSVGL